MQEFRETLLVGHKTSLSKFKKIEILQSIFSDNNGVKLGKKNRKQFRGCTDRWELSDTLLSNQWSKKKSQVNQTFGKEDTHSKTYGR